MNNGIDWDFHGPLLEVALFQTLYLVAGTLLIGGFLGLALGVALYTTPTGGLLQNRPVNAILNALVNFFRPIPFILFIMAIAPFTAMIVGTFIGTTAAIVPLSIATMFGFARIVEQNLVTIPPGVIEAARAAGAGPIRIIFTLLIPEALGPLILGFTFIFVAVIDITAIAGAVGAGGLGDFALTYGQKRWNFPVVWLAIGIIIVLVQLVQFIGNRLARKVLSR